MYCFACCPQFVWFVNKKISDLSHTASLLKGTQPRFRARKPRKTGLITVELQKAFPELNEQLQEEAAVKPGG